MSDNLDNIVDFDCKEKFLMKILNRVSYDYEPYMDKTSYQDCRNKIKKLIDYDAHKISYESFPDFEMHCLGVFDEYFKNDSRIK